MPRVRGLEQWPLLAGELLEVDITREDVVIVSQSCDLANDKIDDVVLAQVLDWSVASRDLIRQGNTFARSRNFRRALVAGNIPSLSLLHKRDSAPTIGWSIVDFHRLFVLPKPVVLAVARAAGPRLRLRSPYREHLQVCLQRSVDDVQSAPVSPALLGGREEALRELPAWSALKTRLGPKLTRVLQQQCRYQEAQDVRHAPEWPQDRPVLLLTGESGQGKTWQLAKLAAIAALGEGLVVLVKATGDTDHDLSAAADVLWKEGLNNNHSLSIERIAQRRREGVPAWATLWLTVCTETMQHGNGWNPLDGCEDLRRIT